MKRRAITLTLTPQVSEAIDGLLATGLFGLSRAQVARELLYRAVREHLDFVPPDGVKRKRLDPIPGVVPRK